MRMSPVANLWKLRMGSYSRDGIGGTTREVSQHPSGDLLFTGRPMRALGTHRMQSDNVSERGDKEAAMPPLYNCNGRLSRWPSRAHEFESFGSWLTVFVSVDQ